MFLSLLLHPSSRSCPVELRSIGGAQLLLSWGRCPVELSSVVATSQLGKVELRSVIGATSSQLVARVSRVECCRAVLLLVAS